MRLIPILTAAAVGLVGTYGLANAQATNMKRQTYGNSATAAEMQSMKRHKAGMKKSMKRSQSKMMRQSSQPRQVRGQQRAAGTGTSQTPVQAGQR